MGTQYYKTLECYVKCRYNAAHTAKELFIHRSTFLNRLERIKELTKLDLDDFASRLYVELSIYRREEKSIWIINFFLLPVRADEGRDSDKKSRRGRLN